MFNIEIAVIVTEAGLENNNSAIQINEQEYGTSPATVQLIADKAVRRAQAALRAASESNE